MHRFAFIMDQQVGLKTQALNWARVAGEDPSVDAAWVPVCYEADAGPLSRLPGLPSGIKGTLRGVREIRDGLRAAGPRDALLWASWAAKSVPDLVKAAPSFLVMDMTPAQMEAMGAQYGYSRARARLGGGWGPCGAPPPPRPAGGRLEAPRDRPGLPGGHSLVPLERVGGAEPARRLRRPR